MHKYPNLSNGDNVLLEIYGGGEIDSEDAAALLDVAESTASNVLRTLHGKRYLKRRNIYAHRKEGGRRFKYSLAYDGTRRVIWLKKNRLSNLT